MFRKILITGVSGQLGSNIAYLMHGQSNDRCTDILGMYNEKMAYSSYIKTISMNSFLNGDLDFHPDLIIHCAALANIDKCEIYPDLAFKSNVILTEKICKMFPYTTIVYISTDSVYSGGPHIFSEGDPAVPRNNYGRTKLLGEKIVEQNSTNYIIVRTNIYGWDNRTKTNSFLERIIQNFVNNIDNNLFYDVFYCPISINLLFEIILECLRLEAYGTYNIVGPCISKLSFGSLICQLFGYSNKKINPISIDDIAMIAPRPKILDLSNEKIAAIHPQISMSTYDQLNNMKSIYKSGYKYRLSNFITIGD
jgi:dTDP-4-dehydrorhamnose reductase